MLETLCMLYKILAAGLLLQIPYSVHWVVTDLSPSVDGHLASIRTGEWY